MSAHSARVLLSSRDSRKIDNYLGEDGSPDGLNLGNLGGRQESLELIGLR